MGRLSCRVCLCPATASIVQCPLDRPPGTAVRIRPGCAAFVGTCVVGGADLGYGAAPQADRRRSPVPARLAIFGHRRDGLFVPQEPAAVAQYAGPPLLPRALQRPAIAA